MKTRINDIIRPLAVCAFVSNVLFVEVASAVFFRVYTTNPEPVECVLSSTGWLEWTSVPGSGYVIERALTLEEAPWEPFCRGVSSNEVVSVKVSDMKPLDEMVFIPGGMFTMGDILGDLSNATPVHSVFLSPFFMQAHEVSISEYTAALQWAHTNGIVSLSADEKTVIDRNGTVLMEIGKYNSQIVYHAGRFEVKTGHGSFPAPYVSWYGAVSYCNWRSQMENLKECYDLATWECDFTRSGFRLPSEAEWEFAARGGYEGMRFPWGDTNVITHTRANYRASTNFAYDVSLTFGLHPDYATNSPPSSPVGSFKPNNYGLYDMCGNVWEWVWDWSARYASAFQVNPTGPAAGTYRVFRGGSWQTTAERDTVASRYRSASPAATVEDVGFRVVLPVH